MIILIFREWQYSAYRSYIHSIFGGLGRMQRKVIPACVVVAIRKTFPEPNNQYDGYH